ncbi:MAG: DinB family protein [Planctomycetota bacterium]|nr:DinB family protein [Planctomycetota bacterium]
MDLEFGTDPADLDRLIEELQKLAKWTTDENRLAACSLPISRWSVSEQLDHLITVTMLNLKAIKILRLGRGQPPSSGLNAAGKMVLELGQIPLGAAQAPAYAQPTAGRSAVELETLRLKVHLMCEDLIGDYSRIDSSGQVLRHFAVGEMGARQWLRFALVHSRHHVAIVERILERTGASSG